MMSAAVVLGAALLVGLAGCAANGAPEGGGDEADEDGAAELPLTADALVLRADQLRMEQGRPVLDALRAEVPEIHIGTAGSCPSVAMRGPDPELGQPEPTIYVDGVPASDTCVLADLPTDLVARVEVYPSGFTPRPGYASNASGLILLFTRNGSGERGAALGIHH